MDEAVQQYQDQCSCLWCSPSLLGCNTPQTGFRAGDHKLSRFFSSLLTWHVPCPAHEHAIHMQVIYTCAQKLRFRQSRKEHQRRSKARKRGHAQQYTAQGRAIKVIEVPVQPRERQSQSSAPAAQEKLPNQNVKFTRCIVHRPTVTASPEPWLHLQLQHKQ